MRAILSALISVLLISPTLAHHSVAEYDRSTLREIEGTLVGVRWRNPHVTFTVRVTDPSGSAQDWELQAGAVYPHERAGLSGQMFSAGDSVRVAGWPSTQRPQLMIVTNMLLPDGQEVLFYPASRIRWSGDQVGGNWLGETVDGNPSGLFRIWSVADFGEYQDVARGLVIRQTAAAQANTPDTSPIDPCMAQGMPSTMMTPLPMQFIDRGDRIELKLAAFGVLRRIHLTPPENLEEIPLSDLGVSVGRWVDDTLEVRTTRVSWPYIDDEGKPQTENVEILERFSLIDNGSRLDYRQTVNDPESLLEPMNTGLVYADIGETTIEPLFCE
ncbi:MAG: DUF6152 family protein [Gammaproteobacteria bacterium]